MTIREASGNLKQQLLHIYSDGEAGAITKLVMEHIMGLSEQKARTDQEMEISHIKILDGYTQRLLQHEPVQYVLQEAWFCGLKLYVDERVLIPRPETEELVECVISNCRFPVNQMKILDIGTGSGCIAIALKRKIRKAEVWACDNSDGALEVASKNARALGADIHFEKMDILNNETTQKLPFFDIIVSNPPYVPLRDKGQMQPNVVKYEPAAALFVPDDDPLLFYKVIAGLSKSKLNPGGMVFVETHEETGILVADLFKSSGFSVEPKKDMQGKTRMLKAFAD